MRVRLCQHVALQSATLYVTRYLNRKCFLSVAKPAVTPGRVFPFFSDLEILWNKSQCNACEWLSRYKMISSESLTLLSQMGAEYSVENVQFPGPLYTLIGKATVEDQVRFLALTLEQIIQLMDAREHMNSVKWNHKTIDNFLSVLHRQSSELKECVAQYHKSSHKKAYEIRIKRHFRDLMKILKKKEYSAQGWEQIRRAVRSHLNRMDIIASHAKTLLRY
ncbi:interferon phi 1 isoform X2 [Myxocyprinus asiaticus]|uniref:interferon phi 1 isoform X2 n=2 Tax=Myxocyprinus asiaticus TaxID=70543 RepID=UPI00222263F0|nr:interferon phi 1 isoform X2 [Myxocyprinus asiaticus]